MDEKYLTIKLVISDLGGNRYRSRIEQSPLGASSGSGWDFELTQADRDQIANFVRKMPTTDLGDADVIAVGEKLFKLVLPKGSDVGQKYKDCLALTRVKSQPKQRLRIAIAVVAKDLWSFPWEYLHDGDGFLVRRNHTIIRVIDELAEQKAPYVPIRRLLIAVANPTDTSTFVPFDAKKHLDELKSRIGALAGLKSEILEGATRSSLEKKIRDGNFDAIYFLGHGTFSKQSEGHLILENGKSGVDPYSAYDLSEALTNTTGGESVRFIYLNSCATAKTDEEHGFAGVAQRLMLAQAVDSAVAMQTNVQQEAALNMAIAFFDELLRGNTVEQALSLARGKANDSHSFGVPVIFSSLAGPEELERNRIAHLLSANFTQSIFGFVLPNFRFGVPIDNDDKTEYQLQPTPGYFYPGETFSVRDMEAAWGVLRLVMQVAIPDQIKLMTTSGDLDETCTHWFLFGSKSNKIVEGVLKNYSPTFEFDYSPVDQPGCWVLRDADNPGIIHKILDPHKQKSSAYEEAEDIGVIEKIVQDDKVFFLFSGLGDRATRGCGLYFYKNWRKLLQESGNGSFKMILKFPGGKLSIPKRVSRKKGTEF